MIVSPLLNLAAAAPTGATLRHSRPLVRLRDSGICGTAMLSLTPDRRTIDIAVTLDRPADASLHLRRLDCAQADSDAMERDLLIVEIMARPSPIGVSCVSRRFSLDRRGVYSVFPDLQDLLKAGIFLSELMAGSVSGIRVEPANPYNNPGRVEYFTERMLTEIAAAECSASAVAAGRHVELATLYARSLGNKAVGAR